MFNRFFFTVSLIWPLILLVSCDQGQVRDAQISGHSMMPNYQSDHQLAGCNQCDNRWPCLPSKDAHRLLCPNCGQCDCEIVASLPADDVEVVVGPAHKPITRWDVVACKHKQKLLVKRVVGLPGETVNFVDGDLYIDNARFVKPRGIQNRLTFPVYRDYLESNPVLTQRLTTEPKARWHQHSGILEHTSPSLRRDRSKRDGGDADKEWDFVTYRHRRCYRSHSSDTAATVDDSYAFNTAITRGTNVVNDLRFEVVIFAVKRFPYAVSLHRRLQQGMFVVDFKSEPNDPHGLVSVRCEERELVSKRVLLGSRGQFTAAVANIDGVLTVEVDQRPLFRLPIAETPLTPAEDRPVATLPLFQIGVTRSSSIALTRLSVSRDAYFFQPAVQPQFRLPLKLADDQYYVIGDNLPVSQDSRHFGPITDVIGVVRKK